MRGGSGAASPPVHSSVTRDARAATPWPMVDSMVGLNVTDDAMYSAYRAAMMPIFARFGGEFVLDVRVAEVLLAPRSATFNRLFTIRFPSQEKMDAFFADPEYVAVRARYFAPSVASVERLVRYGS